jgi:hypothetical protein
MTFGIFAGLTLFAVALAASVWPAGDAEALTHSHADLAADHPHLAGSTIHDHTHAFVIDDLHRQWPAETGNPSQG